MGDYKNEDQTPENDMISREEVLRIMDAFVSDLKVRVLADIIRFLPAARPDAASDVGELQARLAEMTISRDEWQKMFLEWKWVSKELVEKIASEPATFSNIILRGALAEATDRAERAEAKVAAFDQLLTKAKADGMREAAEIVDDIRRSPAHAGLGCDPMIFEINQRADALAPKEEP